MLAGAVAHEHRGLQIFLFLLTRAGTLHPLSRKLSILLGQYALSYAMIEARTPRRPVRPTNRNSSNTDLVRK